MVENPTASVFCLKVARCPETGRVWKVPPAEPLLMHEQWELLAAHQVQPLHSAEAESECREGSHCPTRSQGQSPLLLLPRVIFILGFAFPEYAATGWGGGAEGREVGLEEPLLRMFKISCECPMKRQMVCVHMIQREAWFQLKDREAEGRKGLAGETEAVLLSSVE